MRPPTRPRESGRWRGSPSQSGYLVLAHLKQPDAQRAGGICQRNADWLEVDPQCFIQALLYFRSDPVRAWPELEHE